MRVRATLFQRIDNDVNGWLSKAEVERFMKQNQADINVLGMHVAWPVDYVMTGLDENLDGRVTQAEMERRLGTLGSMVTGPTLPNSKTSAKEWFAAHDANADGKLDVSEAREGFQQLLDTQRPGTGVIYGNCSARLAIAAADLNGDEALSWAELELAATRALEKN